MIIILTGKESLLVRSIAARWANPFQAVEKIDVSHELLLASYYLDVENTEITQEILSAMYQSRQCRMRWIVVADTIGNVPPKVVAIARTWYSVAQMRFLGIPLIVVKMRDPWTHNPFRTVAKYYSDVFRKEFLV